MQERETTAFVYIFMICAVCWLYWPQIVAFLAPGMAKAIALRRERLSQAAAQAADDDVEDMLSGDGDTGLESPSSLETDGTDGEDEVETGPDVAIMSKEDRRTYLLGLYAEMRVVPGLTRAHAGRILAAARIPLNNNLWAEAQGAVAARFRTYEGVVQVPREQLALDEDTVGLQTRDGRVVEGQA